MCVCIKYGLSRSILKINTVGVLFYYTPKISEEILNITMSRQSDYDSVVGDEKVSVGRSHVIKLLFQSFSGTSND